MPTCRTTSSPCDARSRQLPSPPCAPPCTRWKRFDYATPTLSGRDNRWWCCAPVRGHAFAKRPAGSNSTVAHLDEPAQVMRYVDVSHPGEKAATTARQRRVPLRRDRGRRLAQEHDGRRRLDGGGAAVGAGTGRGATARQPLTADARGLQPLRCRGIRESSRTPAPGRDLAAIQAARRKRHLLRICLPRCGVSSPAPGGPAETGTQ